MPTQPKYKKGFTLSHYFDEWWDRRGEDFKIKLWLVLAAFILGIVALGLIWWHGQVEKREMLELAQKRLEAREAAEDDQARKKLGQRPLSPGSVNPRED